MFSKGKTQLYVWNIAILFKCVLSTMDVSKESISKFLIEICWSIPCLQPSWKVYTWIEICASLNHRNKMKAEGSRLIPRKHTETLVLLSMAILVSVTRKNQLVHKGVYTFRSS